ncbi:hypothetical protein AGMMS49983_01350 [Clostridia bacterium]|nr:hypothetical protein AGMMS49983_01350 [Clostridia bacterium]
MFETEKVEKRLKELVQKIGTDFLTDESVFRAVINDVLYDLKLERNALLNATIVHAGKIFLAANDSSGDEKHRESLKVKDKLRNDAAFSEEGADFVVSVLSSALGWPKASAAKVRPVSPPPEPAVSAKPPQQQSRTSAYVPMPGESPLRVRVNPHADEKKNSLSAGNTFTWGKYENKEVEWLVLAIKNEKALIMIKDCIAIEAYNDKYERTTWEECSLRQWLNDDFYRAFESDQKDLILKSELVNEDNGNIPGGNNTRDRIFLLSTSEVEKYFSRKAQRVAQYDEQTTWWWLRSPGYGSSYNAALVDYDGYVYNYGFNVHYVGGVRPALWMNPESL